MPEYKRIDEEIDRCASEINHKWGCAAWRPIEYIKKHQGQVSMMALHRLAQFCIVSSLHDGMNLVAKEYVASRCGRLRCINPEPLYRSGGRACPRRYLVNPFALDQTADAIVKAIEMPGVRAAPPPCNGARCRGREQYLPLGGQDRFHVDQVRFSGGQRRAGGADTIGIAVDDRPVKAGLPSTMMVPAALSFAAYSRITPPFRRDQPRPARVLAERGQRPCSSAAGSLGGSCRSSGRPVKPVAQNYRQTIHDRVLV